LPALELCMCVCVRVCVCVCVCGAAILSVYGTLRFITSLSVLFFPKFKTPLNALTILVYLSVMVIGQYYGTQLLSKMKTMKDQAMKRQLTKLTMFIVVENLTLLLLLVVFCIRTFFFKKDKDEKPWTWFYLKLLEKMFETVSIIVLSLTMMGGGAKKKKAGPDVTPASSGATAVRRTRSKKPKEGGAAVGDVESPPAGAGAAVELTPTKPNSSAPAGSSSHLLTPDTKSDASPDVTPLVPGEVPAS
jgi:hypothetical protein